MKLFAIVSHVLPPSPSGQAVMLYRILSLVDPSEYMLVASRPCPDGCDTYRLQSRMHTIPPEFSLSFGMKRVSGKVNPILGILSRARSLLALLRREPARAIIACSGDLLDIPAAFLAARFARIPFYAYIFDDYVYQWVGYNRRLADTIAPFVFANAKGVIGPNEFICDEYRRRYGVDTALVRNPCDANELTRQTPAPWPAEGGKVKIFYTGAVYHANYDCFRNLLSAMAALPEYPLELHIYTAQSREQLLGQGIAGRNIFIHSHVSYGEILEQQRKADILFLPLAFDSPIPEVIRTSAPGKLGDYLASGRPVLAHVPADCFVADYVQKNQCAFLASDNYSGALSRVLYNVLVKAELRDQLVRNALRLAGRDFSPEKASADLLRAIR